jgi:hypothetical protein
MILFRFMKEQYLPGLHRQQSQSFGLLGVIPGCNGHSSRHSSRQRGGIGWRVRSGSETAEAAGLGCGRLRLLGRGFDGICYYGDGSSHRSLFARLVCGNSGGIHRHPCPRQCLMFKRAQSSSAPSCCSMPHSKFKETSTENTQSLAGEGIVRTHTASTGMIRGPQLGMMFACIPVSWLFELRG